MKTLRLIGIAPLVLVAATSFAQGSDDKAVPRSSGSSSGASAAASRHSGGSSSGATAARSSDSSRRGGASATNDRGSASASAQAAQRRPRPGTGTGDRDRYGNNRGRYTSPRNSYYYYDPYFYSWGSSRYRPYGYGYGYYDYGYTYGDYYGYYPPAYYGSYRYRSGNIAQIRTLVEPSKARVYVDGYYAGIVDDFDGLFQRLNVSPGRHDITFKLEGYQSHTLSIYASRDRTLKLRWDMSRGEGETRDTFGEQAEDDYRPDPRGDRDADRDSDRDADREPNRDYDRYSRDRSREVDSDSPADTRRSPGVDRGELILDIEPLDASVYIDGEFHGKASQVTSLELPAGRHRLEVVRPGYRTEETEVDIDGQSRRVTVKLDRR